MSNLASRLAASESASSTILAKDRTLSCDTRQTGLNNNALVIGPSGAGKTRNVLKPNLLQMNASYIVLDTKGTLCREVGPVLAAHGYRVQCLNFADLNTVPALAPGIERCGYNPLRHIRRKADGRPNQQDILSVAKAICPIEDNNQPFWDHAAANLLSCLIAYVTEQLPADEQTISSVIKLIEHLQDGATGRLFDDLITTDPQSYALSLWRRYAITQNAERMHASIVGILAEKVMCLGFDGAAQLYRECHQVNFASMGHTPCVLFVTVSDIGLATLMWTVPGGAQETGGPYMRDPRHPRHFTDEFKRQIVDLYNAGKPKREIMDEYDLGKSTVERWIKSINATGSPRAACNRTPEQNRILELERENRRLRMEVDVLKQAALIYARK